MGNVVINIAKASIAEKVRDGANFGILLLKSAGLVTDDAIADYTTVTALLAGASDEADFTNYVRKTVANASITLTVNNTTNGVTITIPTQTWVAAGGATNNTTGKLVVYEDVGGADSSRVPLTAHDFVATTDGNDLIAQVGASGILQAS